MFNIPLNTF